MDQVERKEDETKTENEKMTKQKLKLKIERKYLLREASKLKNVPKSGKSPQLS